MKKGFFIAFALLLFLSPLTFAKSEGNPKERPEKVYPEDGAVYYLTTIIAGLALAIAASFGALGQSRAIAATVEAIARQPEAGGRIFVSMIIGLALIETLVIYTLVICFMLIGKLA